MTDLLLQFHAWQSATFPYLGGDKWFLIETLLVGALLCAWAIPVTTSLMVNASAGLAGKYFGRQSRTLVINASTNNPELANMLVSLALRRAGGIANPLGSNLANIYLMYLVAPAWVFLKWLTTGRGGQARALAALIWKEKGLVASHVGMATLMFIFSSIAYSFMTGDHAFSNQGEVAVLQPQHLLLAGAGVCIAGIVIFQFWNGGLQKKRPELFEDIHEEGHVASWAVFFLGTGGLIAASLLLNAIFLAWSDIYQGPLQGVFGPAIFAGLHYFVGALVTSLPELKVAVDNYEKGTGPDLNTALSSASASNMTNLVIAAIGVGILVGMSWLGVSFAL